LDDILASNHEYKHSRHIALIGLRRKDEKHVTRYLEMMLNLYRVNVLFYRIEISNIGAEDHSDLIEILERANQILTREKMGIISEDAEAQGSKEYLIHSINDEESLPSLRTINSNFD
jgi:hypothetical protein